MGFEPMTPAIQVIALHWHRRSQGFESGFELFLFQAFFLQLPIYFSHHCDDLLYVE